MLITCPSCQAEYDVPGSLPAGRMVKCAKCQSKWAPVPTPPPEPEPVSAPAPPPPAPLAPKRAAPRLRRPSVLALAWILSAAVVLGLIAAAVVWRAPVMHAWPPSERLYGVLHLR